MNEDADVVRARTSGSALSAFRRAQAAIEAGDLATATLWIQRARRLAPSDATVQLTFAAIIVHTAPWEAVDELRALTKRQPWNSDAIMALAAALLRDDRPAAAAAALGGMLRSKMPPATDAFRTIASLVCAAMGAPGWISLDGMGRCRVVITDDLMPAKAAQRVVRITVETQAAESVRMRPGRDAVRQLGAGWQQAHALVVTSGGRALLGSGLDPSRFGAVEGFVAIAPNGTVAGWARLPADPHTPPVVYQRAPDGQLHPIELILDQAGDSPRTHHHEAAEATDRREPRWRFTVPSGPLPPSGRLEIVDVAGRHLWGSPVLPQAETEAVRVAALSLSGMAPSTNQSDRFRPLPVSLLPLPPRQTSGSRARAARKLACDVVVPVYVGLAELEACLHSLTATLPSGTHLVLVNDGSPDPAITARLAAAASLSTSEGPRVTVLEHERPRGFPAAINAGLAHLCSNLKRDVIILNSDTIVSPQWLERLSAVAHSDPAIGSCTPLTNDGTIVSYPELDQPWESPDPAALAELNDLCWEANGSDAVDIPSGVGFCMFIKGACLAEVGLFRDDVFAQGYGEENDWCLRAGHLGWRSVAAPGVFVAHSGGRSFGAAKTLLLQRNAAVLERLHPGYATYVKTALAAEPLLPARRRIDRLKLLHSPGKPAIGLITHDEGGGVQRHVTWRCTILAAAGQRAIVLAPAPENGRCIVSLGLGKAATKLPNLLFDLPSELPELAGLLTAAGVASFEIHHLMNHDASVTQLPALLGVPYDVFVHDYGHWCPRITLISRGQRYCGEPLSPDECEECIADLGSRYGDEVTVRGLRAQSGRLLQHACRVAVSCEDVAGRIRRQFPGVQPDIVAWEDASVRRVPAGSSMPMRALSHDPQEVHVLVVGGIGIEKGYEVLLGCARDAVKRSLRLRFTVAGHTIDDDRLMATGRIFITGRFKEDEGLDLVQQQRATLGFLPSVCPETWCYALSLLQGAGLPVIAFALGAQGERVRQSGTGWLLPLGISATRINDALVNHGIDILHTTELHST
jgi:GT2 family glycosyltransferase